MDDFFENLFKQIKNEYEEKYQSQMDMISFWTLCMSYIDGLVNEEESQ